jgi:hypothetical protein
MKLFDQYVEAVKAAFPNPSPAMARYITGLDTIEKAAEAVDIDVELADRRSRWEALTEEEQIACQSIAATL